MGEITEKEPELTDEQMLRRMAWFAAKALYSDPRLCEYEPLPKDPPEDW